MLKKFENAPLYVTATALFGLKTFLAYWLLFNLSIENPLQALILFINPFASAFFFFALSVWLKEKNQLRLIRYGSLVGTIILWANLMFYRDYTDFLTIPVLFQANNAGDVGNSIFMLFHASDLLLFLDVIIIWYLSKNRTRVSVHTRKARVLSLSIILLLMNFTLAEIERPQLLQRTFDREYLVKNIGVFHFHLFDIVQQSLMRSQKVFATEGDTNISEIADYIEENVKSEQSSELFGVAKDKNLIFISLESLQSFLINNEVNGEEVTPFLNHLIKDSYYFENFYHQTAQGKTSDSEFLVDNSLYPLSGGAVFFTHGQNEYHAIPEILSDNGYSTSVFHANNKDFWNRDVMYNSLGYDQFFDETAFELTEQNQVGWGLKDKEFFDQSIEYLQTLPKPFYSKFITLTNHHPYVLNEEDASIEPFSSESETLNNYFVTARYTDEAVEQFFKQLKETGIYQDSIIVLMGDHYGISEYENDALSLYFDQKELTEYESMQLQRVPFIIHIPGEDGKVFSNIAGQINVKPTLLHLLGIDTTDEIGFGVDLLGDKQKEFIAQRDGSFVSDEYVYVNEQCYNRDSGERLDTDKGSFDLSIPSSPCDPIKEKVIDELKYSDQIIYGDLFRFHTF